MKFEWNFFCKLIALNYHRRILFTEIFSYTLKFYAEVSDGNNRVGGAVALRD